MVEFSQAEPNRPNDGPSDNAEGGGSFFFEELAEAAGGAIISVDDHSQIVDCSSAVTGILGFEKQELVGQDISILIPPRYVRKHERAFKHALKEPSFAARKHKSISAMTKDGDEVPIELAIGRWRSGAKVFFTAAVIDDKSRHELEHDLDMKRIQDFHSQTVTSTFLDILDVLSGIQDFDAVLTQVLSLINKLLAADTSFAYVFAKESGTWLPWAHTGLSNDLAKQFFEGQLPDIHLPQELRDGEASTWFLEADRFESDLPPEVTAIARTTGMTRALVLPLVCSRKPKAAIFVLSRAAADFSAHEPEILRSLRHHLEAVISANLHKENDLQNQMELAALRSEVDIVKGLTRIVRTVGSQSKAALHVAHKTSVAFGAEVVAVFSFDAGEEVLRFSGAGGAQHKEIDWPVSYERKDAQVTDGNLYADPLLIEAPREPSTARALETALFANGCRLVCEAPLIFQGNLVGLLVIGFHRAIISDHSPLSIIKRISDEAALAFGNHDLVAHHRELVIGTAESLTRALDAKSHWTGGHSQRTCRIALKIGRQLFLDEEQLFKLRLAALFHDVGKIGTFDEVLDRPNRLDPKSKALMRQHPVKTYEIVSAVPDLQEVAEIARSHHERWDGTGYPDSLAGPAIPVLSRIICIADAIDAMRSERPYRHGLDKDQIKSELKTGASHQFDPALVTVALEIVDSFAAQPPRSEGDD